MTRKLYYEDSYLKSIETKVVDTDPAKGIRLESTIVFPESSTEMGDVGYIYGVPVITQKFESDDIWHIFVDRENAVTLELGASVNLTIDWERRCSLIRHHTALHLLANILGDVGKMPAGGQVHENEAHLIMRDIIPEDEIMNALEIANKKLAENRTVKTWEDAEREGFRYCQIDSFSPIPCGGIHVQSLNLIGKISISEIKARKKKTYIYLDVSKNEIM